MSPPSSPSQRTMNPPFSPIRTIGSAHPCGEQRIALKKGERVPGGGSLLGGLEGGAGERRGDATPGVGSVLGSRGGALGSREAASAERPHSRSPPLEVRLLGAMFAQRVPARGGTVVAPRSPSRPAFIGSRAPSAAGHSREESRSADRGWAAKAAAAEKQNAVGARRESALRVLTLPVGLRGGTALQSSAPPPLPHPTAAGTPGSRPAERCPRAPHLLCPTVGVRSRGPDVRQRWNGRSQISF